MRIDFGMPVRVRRRRIQEVDSQTQRYPGKDATVSRTRLLQPQPGGQGTGAARVDTQAGRRYD
jgi:hypothetical protein